MSDAAHTGTPWVAEKSSKRGDWIKGESGTWVALSCGETDAEASANGDHIVACVNGYAALQAERDRLAKALEKLQYETRDTSGEIGGDRATFSHLNAIARAALSPPTASAKAGSDEVK